MGNGHFSLHEVLERVSGEAASAAGVTAEQFLSLPREVPGSLTGEADGLGLALSCLIVSAAKCAGSGKISVSVDRVSNGPGSAGGTVLLRFSVSGAGAGITGAQAAEFLRDFTSDNKPGPNGGAAGNGHLNGGAVVDSLGGRIAVESAPGKGFAFSFTAGFGVPGFAGRDGATLGNSKMKMPDGLENIRNSRILLVEDHPVNQKLTREILVQAGCTIDQAEDGRQAVAAVRDAAEAYDVILMDIQMPIMDGFEATRIIRDELGESEVPIIAMTANVHGDEREKCIEAGMNDHVPKPIHIPDLYASLIKWISPHDRGPADNAASFADSAPVAESGVDVCLPDRIPGIDIDSGLARAMGNRALYAGLLDQFVETNDAIGADVAVAIDANDLDEARFLVHGLSSTAGNLGADKLHSVATDLEKAIVFRRDDMADLLILFLKTLDGVMEAIRKSGLSAPSGQTRLGKGDRGLDREAARHLMDTLTAMLDDQDLGVLEAAGPLLGMLGGRGHDGRLEKFEASLNALDFAGARDILDGIGKEFLA